MGKTFVDAEGFVAGGSFWAPWVRDLGLQVLAMSPTSTTCCLPNTDRLVQGFGVVCGQAMMAAADTAMVIALTKYDGMLGTVQASIVFLKPVVAGVSLHLEAKVIKVSKTQAYGTVDFFREDKPGDVVAQVTCLFARDTGNGVAVQRPRL